MTTAAPLIRSMSDQDWSAVERILSQGVADGNATFEAATPTWEQFDAAKVRDPRLVAVLDNEVVGWAAASPVSPRAAYRGVIEHSVYVAAEARGRRIGSVLLDAFVEAADAAGYWSIQASIFPENLSSLSLHERAGFRVVGHREAIAQSTVGPYAGQWRDTILVERRLPRTP